MFNLVNLEDVRHEMISEIQADIDSGKLYISDRLNTNGKKQFPSALLKAAESLDVSGFVQSFGIHYFNPYYQRRNPSGSFTQARMPNNANVTLCEGEFNRFYIRAVCIKANASGKNYVTAYRARGSDNPRPESVAIEGQQFETDKLLNDLRTNIGIDTALGLPPGPNSGMSVKL
jgi:hypothetical protein